MILVALVSLFVCLLVSNIAQHVMNGLQMKFYEEVWTVEWYEYKEELIKLW